MISLNKTNINYPTSANSNEIDLTNKATMNKLVSSLIYLFNFSGFELPFLLGFPEASNNQKAMELWIAKTLKDADWIGLEDLVSKLASKLNYQLNSYQEVA